MFPYCLSKNEFNKSPQSISGLDVQALIGYSYCCACRHDDWVLALAMLFVGMSVS
jgi:hypothetical protein